MGMGATVHIETLAGYLPRILNHGLADAYRRNAVEIISQDEWREPTFRAGSTDLGDVGHLMPALEAQAGGAAGTGRGAD